MNRSQSLTTVLFCHKMPFNVQRIIVSVVAHSAWTVLVLHMCGKIDVSFRLIYGRKVICRALKWTRIIYFNLCIWICELYKSQVILSHLSCSWLLWSWLLFERQVFAENKISYIRLLFNRRWWFCRTWWQRTTCYENRLNSPWNWCCLKLDRIPSKDNQLLASDVHFVHLVLFSHS